MNTVDIVDTVESTLSFSTLSTTERMQCEVTDKKIEKNIFFIILITESLSFILVT